MTRWLSLVVWTCACAPDPLPEDSPTEGELSALTYNVQGLPDALSDSVRPTAERMSLISPVLDGWDIVLLQEDFDADNHALLVAEATHPVREWFDARLSPERAYGSGLAQLSRAGELVEVTEEHYTACNGVFDDSSDCLSSKGFQILRVSLGGAEIDIYNTHHEAGSGDEDIAARSTQVDQVIASFEGYSASRAVLFGGDTNLSWDDPEDIPLLQRYADAGLRDACTEVSCPQTDHIDRFLLRDSDDLALTVTEWSSPEGFSDPQGGELSDHPPIAARLRWSTLAPSAR